MPRIRARNLTSSFRHAVEGFGYTLISQRNMRIHVFIGIGVLSCAYLLQVGARDMATLLLVIALVIVAEMFNTCIESAIDLYQRRRHPLAQVAKDVAAAAVLVSAVTAACVGILILGPPLLQHFQ
jgi:diacylglycerol kinase (ATP)